MTTLAVESRIRSLTRPGLVEFVAALFEARGYDTHVEEGAVVATDAGQTIRIGVTSHSLLRDLGVGRSNAAEGDLLVAPNGLADRPTGDRVLDASDLREMLLYAIDRPTATQLCARHLGAPPEELTPTATARGRRWLSGASSPDRTATDATIPVVVVSVIVLVGVMAVAGAVGSPSGVGAGVFGAGAGHDPSAPQTDSAGGTNSSTDDGVNWSAVRVSRTPPPNQVVVGDPDPSEPTTTGPPDGVDRPPARFVATHERALENRSYRLRVHVRSHYLGDVSGAGERRTTVARVAGDRFVSTETISVANQTRRDRAVYRDGDDWYVVDGPRGDATYRRFDGPGPLAGSSPGDLGATLLKRYLSAPDLRVVGPIATRNGSVFWVSGREPPTVSGFEDVREYAVSATLSRSGVVTNLTARFDVPTSAGFLRVTVEIQYDRLGEATVPTPEWHESARRATERSPEPSGRLSESPPGRPDASASMVHHMSR